MPAREAFEPGSPEHIEEIERRLRLAYGHPRHHNPEDPLDDLIFLILSRMTQEVKYRRTYSALRAELPDWAGVRDAPVGVLEEILGDAGLGPTRSRQILSILKEIGLREVRLDLSRLRMLSNEEVECYLTSLPGVATKTARCVMLYALDRDVFPVDAHVWRLCKRLGIAHEGRWTDSATKGLQDLIPEGLRGSLHVTMVAHGRAVCRSRSPLCAECCLCDLCTYRTARDG